ncbi:MAG: HD domain-containing protein [Gammaproteobacteria bacterium]|nr:HD domain-containing protein [Gammaproteobacteria bacterium]
MSSPKEPEIDIDIDLAMQINSNKYVKAVTKLGDKMDVVADEDVLTHTFHKLIAKGTKVDGSFYEKLIQHKLLKPIDRSLMVTDGVSADKLVADASMMISRDPKFKYMFMQFGDVPVHVMRKIHLENPLALKLTLIKLAMPRLFKHSIEVALIAIYIGLKAGRTNKELTQLATAGIFHDISELHINPELQNPEHDLTDDDWHQIYAHPFISYLILKEFPAYHPAISYMTLDHHEKLDGSGYPRGHDESEISSLGHILSVAESVAGLIDKGYTPDEIDAKLKMCQGQFNNQYIHFILTALRGAASFSDGSDKQPTLQIIDKKLHLIGEIIKEWHTLTEKLNEQQRNQMLIHTVTDRLKYLEMQLVGSGFDTEQLDQVYVMLGEDTEEWLSDSNSIIDEAMFQLNTIIGEVKRRWPEHANPHKPRSLGEYLSSWMNSSEDRIRH